MEITTKFRHRKLPEGERLATNFAGEIAAERFAELPITVAHAVLTGSLPIAHKDPFDRLLIAQARIEDLTLVSNERPFDRLGVARLWH
jgi:PIN domain nuclease of toxin-antitoxin system